MMSSKSESESKSNSNSGTSTHGLDTVTSGLSGLVS